MTPTSVIRRALPLSVLLIAAGCSTPCKLILANETDGAIDANVLWNDPYQNESKERSERYSLAANEEKTGTVWYGQAPSTFLVRVTSGSRSWQRTLTGQEYSGHYRRGFLSTSPPRLIVRDGSISFAE